MTLPGDPDPLTPESQVDESLSRPEEIVTVRGSERDADLAALKRAYDAVLYRTLMETLHLFRDFATEAERQLEEDLVAQVREARDDDRPALYERLQLLERSIRARQEQEASKAKGDLATAAAIENQHWLWMRRMSAIRATLDELGLHRASCSVSGRQAHISLKASDASEMREKWQALVTGISCRLKGIKLKISYSTWHQVKSQED